MNKKTRFLLALSVVIVITAAIFGISAYATDDLYDSTNALTEVIMGKQLPAQCIFYIQRNEQNYNRNARGLEGRVSYLRWSLHRR